MKATESVTASETLEYVEPIETVAYKFSLPRRRFVQMLGAGIMVAAAPPAAVAQRLGGRGGGRSRPVAARIHLGKDGTITVLTGKVEVGQGARAEITQAAAEELRVAPERIRLVMADTALVPDDGITAGSRTTPATLPAVRQGAAAARMLLVQLACRRWSTAPDAVEVRDGTIVHAGHNETLTYAALAEDPEALQALAQSVPPGVSLTATKAWKVMGTSLARPDARDLVKGSHLFSSDIRRARMLYGKVLRPVAYGARLLSIDLAPAKAMKEVLVVQDGQFVGVAAPTSFQAAEALRAVAATAKWETAPHPSSQEIFTYLKEHAREGGQAPNPFADQLAQAAKVLRQTYHVAYIQHCPMETRAAVAEWQDGKLTVWAGTQNPFGFRGELARTFHLQEAQVRVIVPDTGGGFGGKHSGEVAVEAARLAQAFARPVSLKWTREEEFTWAYFRPAGVIELEAGLDAHGALQVWHHVNINSGPSAIETPYRIPHARSQFLDAQAPLRQGSYRGLAATANTFARESFMDELAAAAGADPLEFRLAHLENPRLRAVLEEAARRFNWPERKQQHSPERGFGLACGTEKGSYVATCVEIGIDTDRGEVRVHHVCAAFEPGAIVNPDNLRAQVEGCLLMGLGGALHEQMEFAGGKMLNATWDKYNLPRFKEVPTMEIHLLDRVDLPSVGAGETPIIGIAPAIGNALFQATGVRVRQMPLRLPAAKPA